ncbi:hypothetical protein DKX38_021742 [Salix brachista]|uniref:Uncharacterized protein n=1 Tax=Salix brachista TaxID=2182728 RepID=A0A5N5KCI1_9ROSI|nr:hypothetical protein DKX38_021742 [Salix brachista]
MELDKIIHSINLVMEPRRLRHLIRGKGTWKESPMSSHQQIQRTVALRKAGHEKDQSLKDKDDAIEMLAKKVDTLTKAKWKTITVEEKKPYEEKYKAITGDVTPLIALQLEDSILRGLMNLFSEYIAILEEPSPLKQMIQA